MRRRSLGGRKGIGRGSGNEEIWVVEWEIRLFEALALRCIAWSVGVCICI
jgi:hypothetical protein